MEKVKIREIFLSVQGEGPYVGERQLFIRFCKCNLSCKYCDTDFESAKSVDYDAKTLTDKINSFGQNLVLSLTGGEPLMSVEFLEEFLPAAKKSGHKIYLETNGTLPENLKKVIQYIDIVSADIKLQSATGMNINFSVVEEFLKIAQEKEVFAKIVFDKNITDEEISKSAEIAKKYNIEIILQPKMTGNKFSVSTEFCEKVFDKYYKLYKRVRIIPQMHKFLNVR